MGVVIVEGLELIVVEGLELVVVEGLELIVDTELEIDKLVVGEEVVVKPGVAKHTYLYF